MYCSLQVGATFKGCFSGCEVKQNFFYCTCHFPLFEERFRLGSIDVKRGVSLVFQGHQ